MQLVGFSRNGQRSTAGGVRSRGSLGRGTAAPTMGWSGDTAACASGQELPEDLIGADLCPTSGIG